MKVLVTDYVHDNLIKGLEELGLEVIYDSGFDPQTLDELVHLFTGVVINSKIKMTASRIEAAKKLKFIARLGSGLEIIDLEAAERAGVKVFNCPEANSNAVGEHAMAMLLCLCNNIIRADSEVRSKIWRREANRGIELEGKSLGLIGFGNTGQALARKLSGWALNLSFCDPYLLEVPNEFANIERVSLQRLIETSEIISLHVPLTEETRGMVNQEFLENCKPSSLIINTSRGAVVNTKDLIMALKNRIISGACLDVVENEKPHSFTTEEDQLYGELYSFENVVLSPHIAGWTQASLEKIANSLLTKIRSQIKA